MKIQNIARLGGDLTGCDCDEILTRLTALEEGACDCEAIANSLTNLENHITNVENDISTINNTITSIQNEIANIKNDITDIKKEVLIIENRLTLVENAVAISPIRTFMRTTGNGIPITDYMYGLGVSVLSIGPTYNYWGEGTLGASHSTWGQSKYYLVTNNEFEEFNLYQGEATIGTAWFSSGGNNVATSIPVYADATGIYINPTTGTNPNTGTYFKFTLTLILVEAKSPPEEEGK